MDAAGGYSISGRTGFELTGAAASDTSGTSVSAAGDVNGDGFDDLVIGAPGTSESYVFFGFASRALNRTGTEGDDILSGGEFNDRFSGLGGEDLIRGGAGSDNIFGGAGNDTLDGGDGTDTLDGGDGNDRLAGGPGSDELRGGNGDDVFIVSFTAAEGNDNYLGQGGNDTLSFASFTAGFTINLGSLVFGHPLGAGSQFFSSIENVIGGSGADTITGDKKANGLSGDSGNDVLDGGGGVDVLNGGEGTDTVTGGTGLDIFLFQSASSSPAGAKRDTITDYTFKETIDLSKIDADTRLFGNSEFTFIGTGGFSAAGQIRVTQSGANTIIQMNTAGRSGAEMEIALTNYTATALTAADFIL